MTTSYIQQVSLRLSKNRMKSAGAKCSMDGSVENGAESRTSRTVEFGQSQANKSEQVYGGKPN